jgi:xylan 1,4-beta-xylosidase
LGRPPSLFHNGFGLLTVGNLRKPRYWAVALAEQLGDDLLDGKLAGDGAGVLVQALASRHPNGAIDLLIWNGTINAELVDGDPRLDRTIEITLTGSDESEYRAIVARVDRQHSNVLADYPDNVDWPDAELWRQLRAADRLSEQELPAVPVENGSAQFELSVPMPGIARIRLTPGPSPVADVAAGAADAAPPIDKEIAG